MSLHDSSRRHLSTEDWLRAVFEEGRRRKNRDHTPRTLQPDGSQTTEDWLREVVFGTERPEAQALAQIAAAPAAKTPLTPEEQHSPTPYGWGTTLFPGRQAMDRLRAIAAQETPRDAGGRVPVSKTLLTADAGKTASDAGGKPEESAADASGASQRTWRDELLRGLGLGARGVTDGVLNVADTIALPARVPLNLVNGWAGGDPDYFKTLAGNVPDAIGLPHPETDLENIAYHMNSAMASTLATWGLGSLLGMGGKASTMPTTSQSIGRALTAIHSPRAPPRRPRAQPWAWPKMPEPDRRGNSPHPFSAA